MLEAKRNTKQIHFKFLYLPKKDVPNMTVIKRDWQKVQKDFRQQAIFAAFLHFRPLFAFLFVN